MKVLLSTLMAASILFVPGLAGQESQQIGELRREIESQRESMGHQISVLQRQIDDLMFFMRLGDVADIDIVELTGPPLADRQVKNETGQGVHNPLRFHAYVFVPKQLDRSKKQPLMVLPHGGVHSNFSTEYTNVLRELLTQQYTVIAPEYRGSTGYGRRLYEAIDYGGLEIEDTYAARNFMLENYDFLDHDRVGIMGWSHGGLHTLMNIFEHGEDYTAAYAGVPVGDLIARMGYKSQRYRDLYSADFHIGKTAEEDVEEYRRRSPSWNTHKYDGTPLLIHTNTNDEDVNVFEVERIIQGLKANEKQGFEYKIYQDAPGGHGFNRLDTKLARESRREIWEFLGRHLRPDGPLP